MAFNNHAGGTKSYEYVREHNDAVNQLDFIPPRDEITIDYAPGGVIDVEQHDGSVLRLRKLDLAYDPSDRIAAMNYVHAHQAQGEVVTGLLYVDKDARDLHEHSKTTATPLNQLSARALSPGKATLDKINAGLR